MITPTEFMIALVILLCGGFVIGYFTRIIHEIIAEEAQSKDPNTEEKVVKEEKEENGEEGNS